jgi:DNA polymerase III alpha subunit (gram-positive type)
MNKIVSAPFRRRYYLIFDVETNGLLPKKMISPAIDQYPHILQLSFAMYDMETQAIVHKYDSYVNIPDTVVIDDFVSNLTGITKQICLTKGKPICNVLYDFYKAYKMCQGLVGHNLEFDTKMISVEIQRNQVSLIEQGFADCLNLFQPMHEKINNIDRYCTMRMGTKLCNIVFAQSNSSATTEQKPRLKFPKLSELHQKLFGGEMPANLHNSMVDVEVCLRCYLKMRHNIET